MVPKSRKKFKTIEKYRSSEGYFQKSNYGKYIEILQRRWYASNNSIRFRLIHNQTIETMLEDSNLNWILEKLEVELTRDKIQSNDITTVVWLRGPILEQHTAGAIEHTLLKWEEFNIFYINQMELVVTQILLRLERQNRSDKKVKSIHMMVSENRKAQAKNCWMQFIPSYL